MDKKHTVFNVAYLDSAAFSFVVIIPIVYFWPHLIPFGIFEFWTIKGSLWTAILNAWPVFLFGIILNLKNTIGKNGYKPSPGEIALAGFGISLWAGVMEEICFRWLIFISAIVLIPVFDYILLGFAGLHIIQWVYGYLSIVANFFTLGYLEQYLLNGYGWVVAAAVMTTNGRFRKGHSYQGLIGLTVSWFIGMYFFWVMFTYGLIAGIAIHFLYDFLIFLLIAGDAWQERRGEKRLLRVPVKK